MRLSTGNFLFDFHLKFLSVTIFDCLKECEAVDYVLDVTPSKGLE